jgi:hypothetical protein
VCGDVTSPSAAAKAGGRLRRELAPLVAVDLLKVRHGLAERRVADKAKGSDLQQFRGVPARVGVPVRDEPQVRAVVASCISTTASVVSTKAALKKHSTMARRLTGAKRRRLQTS